MKVLITGGLGVVGSCIADRYLATGHDVVVIDAAEERRNRWTWKQLAQRHGTEHLQVVIDRVECAPMTPLLHDVDAVIHAAAHTGIPHSAQDPDDDWRSNVDATKALLDGLRRVGRPIPTVVLSSVKPYRVPAPDVLLASGELDESAVLDPDEPYAASKAAQSMVCMAYARSFDLPVVTLRCSNLYGPAPCHGPRHGWLTWFCISAAIGRPIEVQGDGEQARDMLHVADVAVANIAALYRGAGGTYHISTGIPVTINDLFRKLALLTDYKLQPDFGPARKGDVFRIALDNSRAKRELGWEPRLELEEGLSQTVEFFRTGRQG